MKLTDNQAIKMLQKVCAPMLEEQVDAYPDDERYGRSDLEFLADEVSYYYSLFEEDGHDWKDDYENAKRILRETQNGKVIPADLMTLNPREGYRPRDIENYKSIVDEVARVKRLGKKLQGMGYYGSWYTF